MRCVALPAGGTAVVNADDPHAQVWRDAAKRAGAGVVDFALDHPAVVTAGCAAHDQGSMLEIATAAGSARVLLHVPGRHMAANALAAVAAGLAAGLPLPVIAQGLEAFRPVAGRLVASAGIHGSTVIDDSYNANPDSMRAAIDVLASRPGARWLAMGDMGEVGDQGPEFHREIGGYARVAGIERMFACGALAAEAVRAFGAGASHHASAQTVAGEVAAAVADRARMRAAPGAQAGVTVLVKGSRFMRMERVVAALTGASSGGVHSMLLWLSEMLAREIRTFNVFSYITLRAVLAAMTALVISFVVGPRMIRVADRDEDRPGGARRRPADATSSRRERRRWAAR